MSELIYAPPDIYIVEIVSEGDCCFNGSAPDSNDSELS